MARVMLVLFREAGGEVPLLTWLGSLDARARTKCRVRLGRLAELGHELRRPECDYLGEGIYELRAHHGGVNHRMLYFFHGPTTVVVSHGFAKQRARVPQQEIDVALRRRIAFRDDPGGRTHREEG